MPPVSSLPAFDPWNPWRSALCAPFVDGHLTIEGLGTRPLSDFERFPPDGALPNCYVRLSDSASVREDKVPKETVIFPKTIAQNCLMASMKKAGCLNSKVTPKGSDLTMFTTLTLFLTRSLQRYFNMYVRL